MALSHFHGLFKSKSDANARAAKIKREGGVTRVLKRKAKNGKIAYLVQSITHRGR